MVDRLIEIVRGTLDPAQAAVAVAYLDTRVRAAGSLEIGGQTIELDRDTYVAFVDLAPGANWMHPCRYLLIDEATGAARALEAIQPPAFGPLPASWRVVARGSEVEDWQVLPINATT